MEFEKIEYKAALLGSIHAQGTLFISQNYISFYAKMFNHKTKVPFFFCLYFS